MKVLNKSSFIITLFCLVLLLSCNKNKFLEEKPSSALVIPNNLGDFQRLFDNYSIINETGILREISSDDHYIKSSSYWLSLPPRERNSYIWAKDIYEGTINVVDWNSAYKQVLFSNIVLEGLNSIDISNSNQVDWNYMKGRALFIRGYAFYNLVQTFAMPYDEATAESQLGIPLRLEADVTVRSGRPTLMQTYEQIINDITIACELLPNMPQFPTPNRPCKAAALALLARINISMRNYEKALEYANSSLAIYDVLLDYNNISGPLSPYIPFERATNSETLYISAMGFNSSVLGGFTSPNTFVDSTLFASYSADDLRPTHYFLIDSGKATRKASYSGEVAPFSGLATDEVFLIKAECLARSNEVNAAMNTLNTVLSKRYKTGSFVPLTAANASEALDTILKERRKELVFRGLRWEDLRRLNIEGADIIPSRKINGDSYTLPPNSPLYALPIPPDEIRLSGIAQNVRD